MARPDGCTEEYAPVCGCDGQTYPNRCYAQRAGVDRATDGACVSTASCADRSRDPLLISAGWSFGFCAGTCAWDLEVQTTVAASPLECDGVSLTISGTQPSDPVTHHRGQLTPAGHNAVRNLASDLVGVPLDAMYGCPDCADGGAAYIDLIRGGAQTRHVYGYGVVPAELETADRVLHDIIGGLQSCLSNLYVVPDATCQARR